MIEVNIAFDKKQMEIAQAMLSGIKNGMPKAVSRAINRTATTTNVQASKLIKKEYTIKNGTKGKVTRATTSRLAGNVNFKGRPRQLKEFIIRKDRKGFKASVKRRTGLKRLTKKAFVNKIKNGPAIMMRLGAARYPVKVLHGPSLPQMAGNVNVQPEVEKFIQQKMDERLNHEVDALLKGFAK